MVAVEIRLFVPGRGMATSVKARGDFYDMEHPTGPGSLNTITRATHKDALGTFVRLSEVDPIKIVGILTSCPTEEMDALSTLRQRLKKWTKWVTGGTPSDLARIVAFQWWKGGPLFDSERRQVTAARALLRQCLDALPSSPEQLAALHLLDNPPQVING